MASEDEEAEREAAAREPKKKTLRPPGYKKPPLPPKKVRGAVAAPFLALLRRSCPAHPRPVPAANASPRTLRRLPAAAAWRPRPSASGRHPCRQSLPDGAWCGRAPG